MRIFFAVLLLLVIVVFFLAFSADPRFPMYCQVSDHPQRTQIYPPWSPSVDVPMQYVKTDQDDYETQQNPTIRTVYGYEENENAELATYNEKLQFSLHIPQQNTPEEHYSPILPANPGTPIMYTSSLPEVPEVVPSSPILFRPPVDVQYAYMYPLTPPPTWYSPPVNAEGFIFPHPN